jgi:ABC-type nickel/cobalt efflux system permease component RcnA
LAAGIGAVHALTPGHGKTLVAAYLVGEQGTVWHALTLGLVTTLTHTGVVFVLALLLLVIPSNAKQSIQTGLELVMGLIIVCLGFWLLLRRLSGGADHFHLPGHGHHHHHGPAHHHHGHGPGQEHHHHDDHGQADHYHDEHGHAHPLPNNATTLGWWGLVALGISGGIVPCWDAIAMLFLAVGMNLLWLAFPLLLAFSAGLAGVLVLIGILVVKAKGFADSHWGESRLMRSLPIISAAVVTLMGLWLCYDSVRPHGAERALPRKGERRQVSHAGLGPPHPMSHVR